MLLDRVYPNDPVTALEKPWTQGICLRIHNKWAQPMCKTSEAPCMSFYLPNHPTIPPNSRVA